MNITRACPLAVDLASDMRAAVSELTARWNQRTTELVTILPGREFASDQLLDLVPVLVAGIADCLEHPTAEITADLPVIAAATELAELRSSEGFDVGDILKEYEVLGGVLYEFITRAISDRECSSEDVLLCSRRIFRALSAIEHATTARYARVSEERIAEREERLRRVNRLLTHELKNRVGATLGAGQLLQEEWLGTEERQRFAVMVTNNVQSIQKAMENLGALSTLDGERRRPRDIALPEVVAEVFSQLEGLARARDVDLRVGGVLPEIEVSAAAVELCLSNYVSNAIRFSDASAAERWVEVVAAVEDLPEEGGTQLVVRVRDNGIGVPPDLRDQLFERFFRAPAERTAVEGTGLGLSLVRETMEAREGRAWAEFDGSPGSTFAFSLPYRVASETGRDGSVSDSSGAAMPSGGQPAGEAPAKASG